MARSTLVGERRRIVELPERLVEELALLAASRGEGGVEALLTAAGRVLVSDPGGPFFDGSEWRLPPRKRPSELDVRAMVVRYAREGWTTREIGQALGLTNAKVNNIRRREGVGTNQISGPRAR